MEKNPESQYHPENYEIFDQACKLTARGTNRNEIADLLNISLATITRWAASEEWTDLVRKYKENPRNPELFDQACKLAARGYRNKNIADTVGVSVGTITRWSKWKKWESKVAKYEKDTTEIEQKQPRNTEAFQQAAQLEAAGIKRVKIAAIVNVSVPTVVRWSKWHQWEPLVNEYKKNTSTQPSTDDKQDVSNTAMLFLRSLNLQEMKSFCLALKRNLNMTEKIEVERQELTNSEIIQKLEEFEDKSLSATELMDEWTKPMRN